MPMYMKKRREREKKEKKETNTGKKLENSK